MGKIQSVLFLALLFISVGGFADEAPTIESLQKQIAELKGLVSIQGFRSEYAVNDQADNINVSLREAIKEKRLNEVELPIRLIRYERAKKGTQSGSMSTADYLQLEMAVKESEPLRTSVGPLALLSSRRTVAAVTGWPVIVNAGSG